MKNILLYITGLSVALGVITSCSDWTQPEPAMPTDKISNLNSEEYYANLRAYRNSDHAIMCGYWQGWGGQSSNFRTSLMGLPDSLDIVQMWGAGFNYSEAQKADLKEAQEKKGLKCLLVFIAHSIGTQITPSWVTAASADNPLTLHDRDTGEPIVCTSSLSARRVFWGMSPDDGPQNTPEMDAKAVRAAERYADSLCYIINDKLGLDGFDWDFEYGYSVGDNVGDLIGDHAAYCSQQQAHDRTLAFAKRMREGLGNKLFIIDGNPQALRAPEACVYFDYFAIQAYNSNSAGTARTSEKALDNVMLTLVNAFKNYLTPEFICNHTIMLETFESSFAGPENKTHFGWPQWGFRDGTKSDGRQTGIGTFEGYSMWNPVIDNVQYRKGGIGSYLLNNDYTPRFNNQSETYPQTRRAIQRMNPAVK